MRELMIRWRGPLPSIAQFVYYNVRRIFGMGIDQMVHIQRIVVSAAMLVVVTMSSVGNNVAAQNSQTENQQALNMIANFAAKTCADIPLTGDGLELTGQGKAELSGIFKKIAELGIDVAVKYHEYEGLYQKDLVKALHNSTSCKLEVFKELKDIFFSTQGRSDSKE